MPRNGTKNLIPQNKRTKEQQKEIARKGGIASGEARRKRKTLKEELILMFEADPTIQTKLLQNLIYRANLKGEKTGNAANRAFELIQNTLGETPVIEQKIEVENVVEDLTPLATLLGVNMNDLGNINNNESN